ncbi:214_t:CDS:2, partial [Entrophospora sp. SA101]
MTSTTILQPHQIIKLEKRFTHQEIGDIFGVNKKTIQRWKYSNSKHKQKRGRKVILDKNDLHTLSPISQPTISRALKKLGITYKTITYQSIEQLRKKNQEKINYFIEVIIPSLLQSSANVFFLDETSFHLNMAPWRGYYWKDARLVYQRPGDKGMKTKDFHEFLSEFNPSNNGKKNYLIMDNLSVHKATKSCIKLGLPTIEELLISKNIEPIYLPSYTPELNPVEKCFNIIKKYAENNQSREKELLSFVGEKLKIFQKEDLTKYLDNSIKECLMKNDKLCQTQNPERM